jgi:hypothetical protein
VGGAVDLVNNSGALGSSAGTVLLAQVGLRISTPSKVLLAFLRAKISCSNVAMR